MDRALLRHLAHLSTIATALLAIGGLLVAVWQIRASEASQREASARDAYKEYLKLVIEKPELAEPDLPGSTSGPAREAGLDNLSASICSVPNRSSMPSPMTPAGTRACRVICAVSANSWALA